MAMPETAVYKDDGFVFGQHNVGMAGQLFIMQSVTVALCMEELPHQQLGFGVGAAYLRHVVASCFLIMHIGHGVKVCFNHGGHSGHSGDAGSSPA